MNVQRRAPARSALLEPYAIRHGSRYAHGDGARVLRPGDPGYEEVYQRCAYLYVTYGMPMPYAERCSAAT